MMDHTMEKTNSKKKIVWWIAGFLLVAAIAAFFILKETANTAEQTDQSEIQTARVRTGEMIVSTSGNGVVVSSNQAALGFRSGGVVTAVNVSAGQEVKEGDLLGTVENNSQQNAFDQAKTKIENLFSPSGIAAYQLELVNAQNVYDEALFTYESLDSESAYTDEIAILQAALLTAQDEFNKYEELFDYYTNVADDNPYKIRALADLAEARIKLEEAEAKLNSYVSKSPEFEKEIADSNLKIAQTRLTEAQLALEILKSGDLNALKQSLEASDGTPLAKLKLDYLAYINAEIALENTKLIAPFDGTVVNINFSVGQNVGSNPALTLASMYPLHVKIYLDETDIAGLAVGNRVLYTFNAYTDLVIEGELFAVEPFLQSVEGSPAVVVWGTLPDELPVDVFIGMTTDVEIITGETENALIIPIQGLREISAGAFGVFVLQEDGSLKLTQVTVGLQDFANAEILSGLKAGDVISTGTIETE
jgi:multidrug efflux pump subunit AcrA (membrane-fusion protein)